MPCAQADDFTPTKGRKPRTGEALLRVQFRNGRISRHAYKASQLDWTDRGEGWDVIAVRREG